MPSRSTQSKRGRKCPSCGSAKAAAILYGYPAPSAMLEGALKRGEVALGGCEVTGDDPAWRCGACGHEWGRA